MAFSGSRTGAMAVLLLIALLLLTAPALLRPASAAYVAAVGAPADPQTEAPPLAMAQPAAGPADEEEDILQLPHAFRHQEHYAHRIEEAVSDFKRSQQQQQLKERDKPPLTAEEPSSAVNNRRHDEAKIGVGANDLPHHRRHEKHLQQRGELLGGDNGAPAGGHHLRHRNNHQRSPAAIAAATDNEDNDMMAAAWELQQRERQQQRQLKQSQQPLLRHQQHRYKFAVPTAGPATDAPPPHSTTKGSAAPGRAEGNGEDGPLEVTTTAKVHGSDGPNDGGDKDTNDNSNNHDDNAANRVPTGDGDSDGRRDKYDGLFSNATRARYFDRDGLFSVGVGNTFWHMPPTRGPRLRHGGRADGEMAENRDAPNQRLSLPFQQNLLPAEVEGEDDAAAARDRAGTDGADKRNDGDNDDTLNADDDDDYAYEDFPEGPNNGADQQMAGNEFPKLSVKRFTSGYKSAGVPHPPPPPSALSSAKTRSDWQLNDVAAGGTADASSSASATSEKNGDDAEDNLAENAEADLELSNEKLLKIEREHRLRQQEHHRELQALRARHGMRSDDALTVALSSSSAISGNNKPKDPNPKEDDNSSARFYSPGTLTRKKQEELGTLNAVQDTHRSQQVVRQMHGRELASAHVRQVHSQASCRIPQRRVERLQQDPAKVYAPHCTVLHRCSDDTGCCRSERQTCAPKRTKSVELYFFVQDVHEKRGTIERLTFINHTECHCVQRSHIAEEYSRIGGDLSTATVNAGAYRQRTNILNCNCARLYEKILQEDGNCRCDCSSGNTGCDWLKRGMEHFSMFDRKCISEGRCRVPTCEYGRYMKKHGRCPRREEQLSSVLSGASGGDADGGIATNELYASNYH